MVVSTEVMASHGGAVATRPAPPPAPDWENFAPTPPQAPGRLARLTAWTRGPVRVLTHEWTVVALAGLVLAALANRSLLLRPGHVLPADHGEASVLAYVLGHGTSVLSHLGQLDGLLPAPYRPAYPDALLGYLPLSLIHGAVLRYPIAVVLAAALGFVGTYALARQLGTGRIGGSVAGLGLTLAPWHLGAGGAQPVLATAGLALSLAMLARGHGVRWVRAADPAPVRLGWAIAGWTVAIWSAFTSISATILLAYALLGAAVVAVVRVGVWRRVPSRWLLLVDALGAVALAAAVIVLAQPYQRLLGTPVDPKALAATSPPWRGLLTAPAPTFGWGGAHAYARSLLPDPASMALLPGFVLAALALGGVLVSVWVWWIRLAVLLATAAGLLLVLGGSPYGFVAAHLPGLRLLPPPELMIVYPTLLLALLAAGGMAGLVARAGEAALRRGCPLPRRRPGWPCCCRCCSCCWRGPGRRPPSRWWRRRPGCSPRPRPTGSRSGHGSPDLSTVEIHHVETHHVEPATVETHHCGDNPRWRLTTVEARPWWIGSVGSSRVAGRLTGGPRCERKIDVGGPVEVATVGIVVIGVAHHVALRPQDVAGHEPDQQRDGHPAQGRGQYERALRDDELTVHVEHLPVERQEVADLRRLPQQEQPPAGPGQHRQRNQPQHELLRPHLAGQQEQGDDQEAQLGQAGPARGQYGQRQDAEAAQPEQQVRHGVQRRAVGVGTQPEERLEPAVGLAGDGSVRADVPEGAPVDRPLGAQLTRTRSSRRGPRRRPAR